MGANSIRYLFHAKTGIELIFCENSTISYPVHNHVSVLTVGILLDGAIILTASQETKTYGRNETFAILPYTPHSITAQGCYTMLSLCIDKNAINNYGIKTVKNHISVLLMQVLHTEKISQQQILLLLNRLNELPDFSSHSLKNHNPYIQDLRTQLELYPECRLTVDEMAQNAFTSKYHLIRSFKAEVGLTPHQFQIQNRIRKAQRLIHKTETITEAALATGFCDQSHFIKQFEKYVGIPPLRYKSSSGMI